jgi:site-specific recombinase XerD
MTIAIDAPLGWPRSMLALIRNEGLALLARADEEAGIGFKVHPHMLRHACGYALANKGLDTRTLQAYLGHRSINSTTRYAALAPGRFKNIWGRV